MSRRTGVLLALAAVAAGCLGADAPIGVLAAPRAIDVEVVDAEGAPVALAKVVVLAGPEPVAATSTGLDGVAAVLVPAGADAIAITSGAASWRGPIPAESRLRVTLGVARDAEAAAPAGTAEAPPEAGVVVESILDLGSMRYPIALASCSDAIRDADGDCGLSEPTVEVAGDGTIYYSAVCCIGGAPPVWVSRDGGASWDALATPLGQREAYGIEGDLAVDDAGNVYFFDVEIDKIQMTAWDATGAHLHTVRWPSVPLVDRPWVRAEGDGIVYLVYNNGGSSTFLKSTDRGLTFPLTSFVRFPFPFANPAMGASEGEIWVAGQTVDAGDEGAIVVWHTRDGGATWDEEIVGETPDGPTFNFVVPAVDVAGRPYVVLDSLVERGDARDGSPKQGGYRVYVARRGDDGTWSEPALVSPSTGSHYLPWIAAGASGKVAVAWYGTLDEDAMPDNASEETEWRVHLAVSLDADAATPQWQVIEADPTPVLTGPVSRRLLDFLQVEIGPDGSVHVAYAHDPDADGEETPVHLRTAANLPLAGPAASYPNGPHPA